MRRHSGPEKRGDPAFDSYVNYAGAEPNSTHSSNSASACTGAKPCADTGSHAADAAAYANARGRGSLNHAGERGNMRAAGRSGAGEIQSRDGAFHGG